MVVVPISLGSGRVKRPRVSRSLRGGLMTVRKDSGVLMLDQSGREGSSVFFLLSVSQCYGVMFDETADGLSPDVGDIVANRFGPKMLREDASVGGGQRLVREHSCSIFQSIPEDGLDVIG